MPNGVLLSTEAATDRRFPDYAAGIDGEALVFFVTLSEVHSLPRAAERLGISLSSANRLLAKLRNYWGEPLFVRSGFQMTPTESAKHRLPRVRSILKALSALKNPESTVDPATLRTTVRVAAYDNACAVGVASIFRDFQAKLPHVMFQVIQSDGKLFDDLLADRLDMAFFARQGLPPELHAAPVFSTPYVVLVAKGHSLEKRAEAVGALDREDLQSWRQVLVNTQPNRDRSPNSPAGGWFNPASPGRIAAVLPFFLAVPLMMEGTGNYSVIPEALARLFVDEEKFSLLPVTEKAPKLTVSLAWHERTHGDPAFQLIRSNLLVMAAERVAALLTRSPKAPAERPAA